MGKNSAPRQLEYGNHHYEKILEDIKQQRYDFKKIRTASGRIHYLLGITPSQYEVINEVAKKYNIGFIFLGSRVVGPRTQQRFLHPVIQELKSFQSTPIISNTRLASATYHGFTNITIHKESIKEFGIASPHTSDLTLIVIYKTNKNLPKLEQMGIEIENTLKDIGCSFPLRVFTQLDKKVFRTENDFIEKAIELFLLAGLEDKNKYTKKELKEASQELYSTVNLPTDRSILFKDFSTGMLSAGLVSLSFYIALHYHPIVTLVGFMYGFFGRYLARLRAYISQRFKNPFISHGYALGIDTAIGIIFMAGLVNPMGQFHIPLMSILYASVLHTLSKGTFRLSLDKIFSPHSIHWQTIGVIAGIIINFLHGLITSFIYAGNKLALIIQLCLGFIGIILLRIQMHYDKK